MVIESLCHFSRSDWVILVWANDWRGPFWGRDPIRVRLLARSSFCTFGTTDRPLSSSSLSSSWAFCLPWGLRKGLSLRVTIGTSVEVVSDSLSWSVHTLGSSSAQSTHRRNRGNISTNTHFQHRKTEKKKTAEMNRMHECRGQTLYFPNILHTIGMFPVRSWNLLRK